MSTRILVCDDDACIRRAVCYKLQHAGLVVETAADGAQAWESAQRRPPALLITDCQMPRLNGIELCRRMGAIPATKHVRNILLTGKGLELDGDQLSKELQIVK
jgi:CheY-like chemotaxis protein